MPDDPTDHVSAEVAAGLASVRGRIAAAEARAGRPAGSVTLVAVSKRQPLTKLRAALALGVRDLGENYAQELRERADALAGEPAAPELRWHAIGPLQRNKARLVATYADVFHALDRQAVGAALSRHRVELGQGPLRCLVEVNLAAEPTKAGVAPSGAAPLLAELEDLPGILVVGLMAMPPPQLAVEAQRPAFARLRELASELGLSELSMGTTDDFEVAIEEGATAVRVGRAVFGEREG